MKCPRCKGENCQYVTTSETYSKGFDSGDACCGLLFLGPIGLLCGLCGSESNTKVKEYWVCHDCGNKFNASGVKDEEGWSEILPERHQIRFYYDVFGTNILQQSSLWNKVQDGYQKYIAGTVLEPYFWQSAPDEENKVYRKMAGKCVRKFGRDVDVLFAIPQNRGMLMVEKGLFIYDCFIPNERIGSILLYRNVIFINRIAYELNTEQEADILFRFLTFFYPQASSERENHMEEAVEKLRSLKAEKGSGSDKIYFNKSRQYKEYVAQMTDEYTDCYLTLHPGTQYNKYQNGMQRVRTAVYVALGIEGALLVVLLVNIGLWGLLVSGGIWLASVVIGSMIEANYKKLLPGEMVTLLNESIHYEGTLNLLEYRNMINEMKIQISGSENGRTAVKYCTKCGKPLEKTWMSCPYCGNE